MRRLVFTLFALAFPVALASAQDKLSPVAIPVEIPVQPRAKGLPDLKVAPKPTESEISPNTGMPRLAPPEETKNYTIIEQAMMSSGYTDPRYVENSANPDKVGIWEKLRDGAGEQVHRLVHDFENFYCTENVLYVGLAVGIAAPIANTQLDQDFTNWYQRQAGKSTPATNVAKGFQVFGELEYTLPAYLALSTTGHLFPDDVTCSTLGAFGDRSLRAMIVGAPTVAVLEMSLGANGPNAQDSHWHPLRTPYDSVATPAFIGAIPFLTAASMTDCVPLQALLVVGSAAPSWAQIQRNDHYLSQALLGWSIGMLSVRAVNLTEAQATSHVQFVPVELPKGMGVGVQIKY